MLDHRFLVRPTKEQFKWLADQLRSVRKIISVVRENEHAGNPFGSVIPQLDIHLKGEGVPIVSSVNAGMQGLSRKNLTSGEWDKKFQLRSMNGGGLRQYPDGAFHIPAMASCGMTKLLLQDCPVYNMFPITYINFELDTTMPNSPVWWATVHENQRPPGPPRKRRITKPKLGGL